jgi:hypothetical protein
VSVSLGVVRLLLGELVTSWQRNKTVKITLSGYFLYSVAFQIWKAKSLFLGDQGVVYADKFRDGEFLVGRFFNLLKIF